MSHIKKMDESYEPEEWELELLEKQEAQKEILKIKGSLSDRGTYQCLCREKHFVCFDCSGHYSTKYTKAIPKTEILKSGRKVSKPICQTCDTIRLAEEVGL